MEKKVSLILDGAKYELQSPDSTLMSRKKYFDIDEDNKGLQEITQSTETGEALKELNSDEVNSGTRMSGIDMRARLHVMEVSGITALNSMIGLQCLPVSTLIISRSKLRLSVSQAGLGRQEIVQISQGLQQQKADQSGGGFFSKIGGLFSSKQE